MLLPWHPPLSPTISADSQAACLPFAQGPHGLQSLGLFCTVYLINSPCFQYGSEQTWNTPSLCKVCIKCCSGFQYFYPKCSLLYHLSLGSNSARPPHLPACKAPQSTRQGRVFVLCKPRVWSKAHNLHKPHPIKTAHLQLFPPCLSVRDKLGARKANGPSI